MNFPPIAFQLFNFLHYMVSITLFGCQYIGHIENISRIRRCDNLGLSLQSTVCILYIVCFLNPICSLQSAFYTDRLSHDCWVALSRNKKN